MYLSGVLQCVRFMNNRLALIVAQQNKNMTQVVSTKTGVLYLTPIITIKFNISGWNLGLE